MSTRSVINFHFHGDKEPSAKVYRHYDGHPETVQRDLDAFFADVETQCGPRPNDRRFSDPSYLAAKYIVWQAGKYADGGNALHFSGVGPILGDPGDIEYVHTVMCAEPDYRNEARPTVDSKAVSP